MEIKEYQSKIEKYENVKKGKKEKNKPPTQSLS